MPRSSSASVRLCCLGADERFLHSLVVHENGDFFVDSRSRPFDRAAPHDGDDADVPALVRTQLPDELQDALRVDAPVELFALADGARVPLEAIADHAQASSSAAHNRPQRFLAHLCLYSRKAVYCLQLQYQFTVTSTTEEEAKGTVARVREPFQRELSADPYLWEATTIVRVRPAPTHTTGHSIISPAGSLAMLTFQHQTQQHALILYHAGNGTRANNSLGSHHHLHRHHDTGRLTKPLEFGLEECLEGSHVTSSERQVVDFCFAVSQELGLLSALSILLIKGSGDVLIASPVAFHGTVVKRSLLQETLEFLDQQLIASQEEKTSSWRQCQVAKRYLKDVFLGTGGDADKAAGTGNTSHFVTAKLFDDAPPSVNWPLKIQGPVLYACVDEPGPPAWNIECFGRTNLVGIACGMEDGQVDFALVLPTACIPRFSFESIHDGFVLDEALVFRSNVVERVHLGLEPNKNHNTVKHHNASMRLLPDPVVDTLLHVCTMNDVCTISTNAVRLMSREILKQSSPQETLRTTAWPCLNGASSLQGIVVSGDAYAGHEIIAQTTSQQIVCINVSQTQTAHELEAVTSRSTTNIDNGHGRLLLSAGQANTADDALRILESTPPLVDVVAPILKQIEQGLGGLNKFVGSETRSSEISPEQLAVVVQLHEKCNQNLILPLLELRKVVETRKEKLLLMVESQQQQVADLTNTIVMIKEQIKATRQSLETASTNASILSERSATVVQASKDLIPTITQAEYDFFQAIKRMDARCKQMEKACQDAIASQTKLSKRPITKPIMTWDPETVTKSQTMLYHTEIMLAGIRSTLRENQATIDKVS
jgi:hypothetical protein